MKKAIISCLFGNYDQLNQAPNFKGWDTILFTDTKPQDSKGWEIRLTETYSAALDSRCYKFLSHIHLPEYDLVCYQDANIILKEEPPSNPVWFSHPRRKKIADECARLVQLGKMNKEEVAKLFKFFRQNRFNDNAGLYQNGVFVRNHSENMNKLMEMTFDVIVKLGCRDQLALPYATSKLGYRPEGTVNYSLNDNQIEFLPHNNQPVIERIQVHFIVPARSDKNLGKAANQLISNLPENDWICLMDIDTIPPFHEKDGFIKQCEEVANSNSGFSLIGCMTNRLGLKYQLVPGMFNEWDMRKHRLKAKELSLKKGVKSLGKGQTVGGVMMLFPKSSWVKAGGFPEGGISINNNFVDYHFSKAVGKFGKLGIAQNIYVFHHYRPDAIDTRTAKDHLR